MFKPNPPEHTFQSFPAYCHRYSEAGLNEVVEIMLLKIAGYMQSADPFFTTEGIVIQEADYAATHKNAAKYISIKAKSGQVFDLSLCPHVLGVAMFPKFQLGLMVHFHLEEDELCEQILLEACFILTRFKNVSCFLLRVTRSSPFRALRR